MRNTLETNMIKIAVILAMVYISQASNGGETALGTRTGKARNSRIGRLLITGEKSVEKRGILDDRQRIRLRQQTGQGLQGTKDATKRIKKVGLGIKKAGLGIITGIGEKLKEKGRKLKEKGRKLKEKGLVKKGIELFKQFFVGK